VSAEPQKRLYIDALRGWAILLVVLTHAEQGQFAIDALGQAQPHSVVPALPEWLHQICAAAGAGVDLFFVVSALSLTLSWQARGEAGWRDYLIRRFFRIAPMFYAGVVLYLALYGWRPRLYAPNGIGPGDVALTLGFVHVWSTQALNSVVPGDWSIGVEAMFYLILPLLLTFGWTRLRLAMLTAGFVLLSQAMHWYGAPFGPFGIAGFPSQAGVFLFGLCAAWHASGHRHAHAQFGGLAVPVFLFLVAGLPLAHLPEGVLAYHLQFAIVAGLLCVLLERGAPRLMVNQPIARLGRISFSLYVLHFALFAPVFALARYLAPGWRGPALLALYYPLLLAAAIAAAAVTYAAIERPGMRLGRVIVARLGRHLAVERA
jgi:exopolysaccharide production protein ExoZ